MRKKEDWVAIIIVAVIVFSIALCGKASAEPSEAVLQTIAMESSGESLNGQYAVASVIINRAGKIYSGNNAMLEYVCLKQNQFSCWNDKERAYVWLRSNYTEKVRSKAKMALEMAIISPIKGITHYHTNKVKPYWAKGHKPVAVIGAHSFYEGIK